VVVRFARDGSQLLVIGGKVLYRLPLGESAASAENRDIGDDSVTDLDSYDGRIAFLARSLDWPPIWRLDTVSGEVETLAPTHHEVSKHHPLLALSPDGRRLAFGHVFDAIEIFDLAGGTSAFWPMVAAAIPGPEIRTSDMLAHLNFTADGKHLYAVSQPRSSGRMHILRIGDASGQKVRDHSLTDHLPTVAVAVGGRVVAAARRDTQGRVDIVDLVTGEIEETIDIGSRVMDLALDPTACRLTVAHESGVAVLTTETI